MHKNQQIMYIFKVNLLLFFKIKYYFSGIFYTSPSIVYTYPGHVPTLVRKRTVANLATATMPWLRCESLKHNNWCLPQRLLSEYDTQLAGKTHG